ncbi:MAG: GTP cyclohydrolase [Candidatus Syntrophoarchaeum caldarius]|uniref:GTP cyclohydrolase MptA n=1 Tax=Candidatus Syntropharchaeum caldarium TaxID=1838285 RepID=A0A1F2P9V9_9EURY|nr:MAG: GTP cyclohydrolase [Candidatus Syntrophoarchaeum caldarius]
MIHEIPLMVLPDVQSNHPDIQINLTRVGVKNVKKLVEVARDNKRPIILISTFNIFVDLPREIKGANLSRNFEAIDEVLEEAINAPVYEIEELCSAVARKLLDRHEYASRAEVQMQSEYIIKRRTPITDMQCQEIVDIYADAIATGGDEITIKRRIGAEVLGITTCPCAQEIMRELAADELSKLGLAEDKIRTFLKNVPMATHNQRGRGMITIEVSDGVDVSLDEIIEIIEESMSSRIFELLKRVDEASIVEAAHRRPRFVEDCVRAMAKLVVERLTNLPDDSIITIMQTNEESIHRHNAFAERVATLAELRSEI